MFLKQENLNNMAPHMTRTECGEDREGDVPGSIPWTNHEYSEWQCRLQRNFGLKLEPWFVMTGPVGLFPGHLHHTHSHHPSHHPVTFSWKETQITQN